MTSYFSRGFGDYLKTGNYSDLILKSTENDCYKVHKIILCKRSEYFKGLITGGFSESNQSKINLGEPDPCKGFPFVLEWIYTGDTTINEKTAVPLVALSDFYGIADLKLKVSDFIEKNISKDNVCVMMNNSLLYDFRDLTIFCSDIMAKNLTLIKNLDLELVDYEIFLTILSHPYLRVTSEFKLFQVVQNYIQNSSEELSENQKEELLTKIGYREMTVDELSICAPYLKDDLLIDALMYNLHKYECPNDDEYCPSKVLYNKKRVSCTTFPYLYEDFHQDGIIYYISTNGKTTEWSNPHLSGLITVFASSIAKGEPQNLLQLTPSELWTMDQPSSWIIIDFGSNRLVRPTHYSLRHGGNYRSDFLRQWEFGASNDKKNWTLLRRHLREETLSAKFATHTWNLNFTNNNNSENKFRFFRILQTGRNSAHHNFLAINGFELYGDLFEETL